MPLQMAMSPYTASSIGGASIVQGSPMMMVPGYGTPTGIPAYTVYNPSAHNPGAVPQSNNVAPMQLPNPLTEEVRRFLFFVNSFDNFFISDRRRKKSKVCSHLLILKSLRVLSKRAEVGVK